MDDLCNLLDGMKIKHQHYYFDMAKKDISLLAYQFYNFIAYDSSRYNFATEEHQSGYILINHLRSTDVDVRNLEIVVEYIITYGDKLFLYYLSLLTEETYFIDDYIQYLNEYTEEVRSFM